MASVISYKLILIGSSGVGKSALMRRLVEDTFTDECQSTIGVEFDSKVVMVEDQRVKLQIWDTVYDITERKTFEELGSWLTDVHSLCEPNAVIELVGNKTDLAAKRTVTENEALDFCQRHQMEYIETSAKGGDNVRESFVRMASTIIHRGLKSSTPALDRSPLGAEAVSDKSSCC